MLGFFLLLVDLMKRREGQWKMWKAPKQTHKRSKGFSELASWLSGKYHMVCDLRQIIKETAAVCSCYVFIRCLLLKFKFNCWAFHVNTDGHCESHLTNLHCHLQYYLVKVIRLHSYDATEVVAKKPREKIPRLQPMTSVMWRASLISTRCMRGGLMCTWYSSCNMHCGQRMLVKVILALVNYEAHVHVCKLGLTLACSNPL